VELDKVDITKEVSYEEAPWHASDIDAFRKAVKMGPGSLMPLTLVTRLRRAEFEWLSRFKIDMHQLLHTVQEYEYFGEIELGTPIQVKTRVANIKERKGKTGSTVFVEFETEVKNQSALKLIARTHFVVRT
jgi:hypothetical protein